MGGNALLYAQTARKTQEEYSVIMQEVRGRLIALFPAVRIAEVISVNSKEDFGDGDILINMEYLPDNWIARVWDAFKPTEMMINKIKTSPGRARPIHVVDGFTGRALSSSDPIGLTGMVPQEPIECSAISFDFMGFQIDLICTKPENFQIAQVYYAYNDLGNLMGRIADRMGFKYGWSGLRKQVGEGTSVYDEVLVTNDPKTIFRILGYDYERWKMGFETFENMFQFASSSPYFHRGPYQLENRNHKDRIRDQKRSTYQAFVSWIADKPWLDRYTWSLVEGSDTRKREKDAHLLRLLHQLDDFSERYHKAKRKRETEIRAKTLWNGGIVGVLVGYSGVQLGEFMNYCRKNCLAGTTFTFEEWVVEQDPESIKAFVAEMQRDYEKV